MTNVKVSEMIKLAKSQIGYKDGDAQVLKYIRNWEPSWGLETPWCACFLTWLADQSGLAAIRGASVPTMVKAAKAKGLWLAPGQQNDGDFVVYTYSANGNPDHIGLDIGGGYSIDGNFNDCVCYHQKDHVLGYIKNTYAKEQVMKKIQVVYDGSDGLDIREGACYGSSVRRVAKKGEILSVVADLGDMYMLEDFLYVTNEKAYVLDYVEPAKAKKQKIKLPTTVDAWRVYPLNKAPVVGNECGKLLPSNFKVEARYLEYDVIKWAQPDVAVIQTRDFGIVQIYVGKDTSAKIE